MYAMYDLNSLAVVNVRDLGPVKMAFKILAYPDTRLFQCGNNNSKVSFFIILHLIFNNLSCIKIIERMVRAF